MRPSHKVNAATARYGFCSLAPRKSSRAAAGMLSRGKIRRPQVSPNDLTNESETLPPKGARTMVRTHGAVAIQLPSMMSKWRT